MTGVWRAIAGRRLKATPQKRGGSETGCGNWAARRLDPILFINRVGWGGIWREKAGMRKSLKNRGAEGALN